MLLYLALGVAAIGALPPAEASAPAIARAAGLIRERQLEDGAIVMGPPGQGAPYRLVPYFSSIAAIGLVDAGRVTRDPALFAAARRWAVWYERHMNPDGTVNDYSGAPGAWKSTGDYDSTDSYAGTYLELLEALHSAAPERDWLRGRAASMRQAVAAIKLTLQPNGLTLAKPTYPVMYTMDNSETARGLRAGARVARASGQAALARECGALAARMERAVATELWDAENRCYLVGLQPDGYRHRGFAKWYPDVMASLMAVAWLPRSERNVELLARMLARWGGGLPREVKAEGDVGVLVWWGVAARGAGDRALLRRVRAALEGFDAHVAAFANPADLGMIASVLAAARR